MHMLRKNKLKFKLIKLDSPDRHLQLRLIELEENKMLLLSKRTV